MPQGLKDGTMKAPARFAIRAAQMNAAQMNVVDQTAFDAARSALLLRTRSSAGTQKRMAGTSPAIMALLRGILLGFDAGSLDDLGPGLDLLLQIRPECFRV